MGTPKIDFSHLSPAERLQVEELWDSLTPDEIPITDEQPRLLLKPEAEADIAEAFDGYEAQRTGVVKGKLGVPWCGAFPSASSTSSSLISLL